MPEDKAPTEETSNASWSDRLRVTTASIALVPLMVFSPLIRAFPATWRIYHKLHLWSGWQMQRAASADSLANVRRSNGKEDVLPAAWVEGAEDEKDRSGWKVKGLGAKRFDSAVHGRSTTRLGKADIIHINEDDTEQGTWTEATVDSAFQLDRERYLFRDAKVSIEQLIYDVGEASDAVADGGVAEPARQLREQDISLAKPGVLEDVLVPITSRQGYDGQVISWNQYSNLKNEQSDQETVRDAKNSAWAAAKLDDIERADIFKWVMILGAIGLILLFHAEIGTFIAGLSGGGGGGAAGGVAGGALG